MEQLNDQLSRRWKLVVLAAWVAWAAWLLFDRAGAIHGFALGDTDDNLRLAQVRALLSQAGFAAVQSRRDLAGHERCSGGQWLEQG